MSRPARAARRGRSGRARAAGWALLLLGSLLLVTWRQTRGLAMESGLRELEADRAVSETERVELVRRIEELRSRARIVRVARERLGMRVPDEEDVVYLPIDPAADSPAEEGGR